jgi:hypothetical protein
MTNFQARSQGRSAVLLRVSLRLLPVLLFLTWIFVLSGLHPCFADARKKTDVVYMLNGDKITCEIQSLSKGELSVKPDYTAGSIVLDWTKVGRVESTQKFIVRDPKGVMYTGTLTGDVDKQTISIVEATTTEEASTTTLPRDSVVEIDELGTTFVRRLSGNVSVGTSFAKSNDQRTLTVQSLVKYQSERYFASVDSNSQFASQKEVSDTNETTVKNGLFRQLRRSNWYGGGIANFLTSSEQEIALQSTLGGAVARRFIFTNKTNLTGIGGLGYTIQRNNSGTVDPNKTHDLDAALAVQYSTFRFNSTSFDTTVWAYPSLTSAGHVRMTLNQDVYYKFLGNFYLSVSFYDNYDNQPVVGAPENNLGASTSIGWSFP